MYCAILAWPGLGTGAVYVLVEAVDGRWYVATARDMNDTERRTFRRKGR